ncbi:hypothetical protein, partial [Xanthomonas hortorum]|uniref:hypothetical protein n=1 Tax=Xanthomonas hortorum TaxID=56454 RepID=UPI0019D34006
MSEAHCHGFGTVCTGRAVTSVVQMVRFCQSASAMAMTAGFARCWLHQVASAAFAGTPCSNTLHVNQAPFFRQTSTEIVGACARTGVGP